MKAGEHKGVEIFFSDLSQMFWTSLNSPVKDLIDDSYKGIKKQIDERLGEKEKVKWSSVKSPIGSKTIAEELKPTIEFTSQEELNSFVGNHEMITLNNPILNNCSFENVKGYHKLSAEQKTLINNLVNNLNEKK